MRLLVSVFVFLSSTICLADEAPAFTQPLPSCADIQSGHVNIAQAGETITTEADHLNYQIRSFNKTSQRNLVSKNRGEITEFDYFNRVLDLNMVAVKLRAMQDEINSATDCLSDVAE